MAEYEQAAYTSLSQLNEEYKIDLQDLRKRIISDYPIVGKQVNKKIIEYKNKEKILTQCHKYDEAEIMKRKREALEATDMANFVKQDIYKLVQKEELKLKAKHEVALTALLKRIQRDRNEQLLHRQIDSKRIIQRNKNLINNILKKHELEIKKTKEFLHFLLGTRGKSNKPSNKNRSQSNRKRRDQIEKEFEIK